jgi:putative endonuclease
VSRILEHKQKKYPKSFSAKYNLNILVYFESFPSMEEAIEQEKYINGKVRKWKDDLINARNPQWEDLWDEIKDW